VKFVIFNHNIKKITNFLSKNNKN